MPPTISPLTMIGMPPCSGVNHVTAATGIIASRPLLIVSSMPRVGRLNITAVRALPTEMSAPAGNVPSRRSTRMHVSAGIDDGDGAAGRGMARARNQCAARDGAMRAFAGQQRVCGRVGRESRGRASAADTRPPSERCRDFHDGPQPAIASRACCAARLMKAGMATDCAAARRGRRSASSASATRFGVPRSLQPQAGAVMTRRSRFGALHHAAREVDDGRSS